MEEIRGKILRPAGSLPLPVIGEGKEASLL